MIVSDLSRLGVVAGLAAVDATGHLSLPLLLAFAAGVGLGDGFFHPAFGGMVPLIVEQPLMASANALIGMSRNLSFVIGPALAAFLYARAGSSTVFAFDAWTFLVSAGLLWLARPRAAETRVGESTWRDIASGFAYVARIPWLWVTIVVASVVLMIAMAPYQSLLPKLVRTHFHHGVGGYGTLFTFQAIGMVLGAVLFGQLNPRRHRVVVFFSGYAINDVCVITMALVPVFWIGVALVAVRGAFIGFSNAMWETVLVELVPESMLSRVVSLDFFGSFGLTPVGYALTAGIAGFFTPSQILVVAFTLATALWLLPLASTRVRSAA
jgi:DHA3 family tetracycline resistance protein-like MFS transporter